MSNIDEKIKELQKDYVACMRRIQDLRNRKWTGELELEFSDGKILWMLHKPVDKSRETEDGGTGTPCKES